MGKATCSRVFNSSRLLAHLNYVEIARHKSLGSRLIEISSVGTDVHQLAVRGGSPGNL